MIYICICVNVFFPSDAAKLNSIYIKLHFNEIDQFVVHDNHSEFNIHLCESTYHHRIQLGGTRHFQIVYRNQTS